MKTLSPNLERLQKSCKMSAMMSLMILLAISNLLTGEPQRNTKSKRSPEIDADIHSGNIAQDSELMERILDSNQSLLLGGNEDGNLTNRNKSIEELMKLELFKDYPLRDPLSIAIPMTIIYSLILLSGLIGNIFTCCVIYYIAYMRTSTNLYLFSLAMSDLLLLISGVPQEIFYIWMKYPYIFGEVICVIRGLAAETSANATVLTITAFTVERFIAILFPLKSHLLSQLSRVIRTIAWIWLVAFCFAIPQAVQFGIMDAKSTHDPEKILIKRAWCTLVRENMFPYSFQISICVFFAIPMTIITVLYILIGLKLRRSRMKGPLNPEPRTRHQQSHVIRMLVAVVVGFFLCWGPFHLQRLMALYANSVPRDSLSNLFMKVYKGLMHVSGILYYLSTCINPILYHIMSKRFREAYQDLMKQICGQGGSESEPHLANRNYSITSYRSNRLGLLKTGSNNSLAGAGTGKGSFTRNHKSTANSNTSSRRQQADVLATIEESEKHSEINSSIKNQNSKINSKHSHNHKKLSPSKMDSGNRSGFSQSNSSSPTAEVVMPMSLLEKNKRKSPTITNKMRY